MGDLWLSLALLLSAFHVSAVLIPQGETESPFLFRPAKFGPVVGTDDIIPAPGGYEKVNEAFWREPCRLPRQVQKRLERAGKESCSVCVGKMVGSGVRVPIRPRSGFSCLLGFLANLSCVVVTTGQILHYTHF